MCYVTGNASPGQGAGTNDVDGGRTTLLTPVFDAVGGGLVHPIVEYYRWFSNDAGAAPDEDFWRVDLSNDGGGNWVPLESTQASDASWRRTAFRIEDFLAPTSTMRLRFIAADEFNGSLVEAAVDDFRLLGFATTVSTPEPPAAARLALAPGPNPFASRTVLRFTLPARGPTSLRVFDLSGRAVRELARGTWDAGAHAIAWDGRDDGGRTLPAGLYFARLEQDGHQVMQRLMRLR
jgi:hypothetical protein